MNDAARDSSIDHDRLWVDYQRSLVDTLRGFSSGLEDLGLAAFVPHEDPWVSLRNLLDAAAAAGRAEISVRFGPASRTQLDVAAVRALAAGYGHARILATDTDVVVAVAELHVADTVWAAPVPEVRARVVAPAPHSTEHPRDVYAAALAAVTGFAHEGPPQSEGSITLTATAEGTQLFLAVDEATHTIRAAGFAGTPRPLLECFCTVVTGLPLLEAAQHGVIHLEAALRAPGTRPVAGIVTPRAAHPMFALPTALIRAALATYRARTGYAERTNQHDPGPGPAWRAASPAERAARIAAVVAEAGGDFTLIAIEHEVRLVFAAPGASPDRLFDLEARIRRAVDARLEVYAEERKDRNKLRKLGSKKESR
jgi:hypothetical protein